MNEIKFGAGLLNNGRQDGHIFLTDTEFIWKPLFGHNNIQIPIEDIFGYKKFGTTLYLGVNGVEELMSFYVWKGNSIIEAIKERNPQFRQFSKEELTSSGCSFVLLLFVIASFASASFIFALV